MLKTQEQYIDFLQTARQIIVSTAEAIAPRMDAINLGFSEKVINCKQEIEKTQLLIPVVGAFSAGKSSLINTFLQINQLPVAITPETALATELHFSNQSRIEGINAQGEVVNFPTMDAGDITNRAKEFEYCRMYFDNPYLQRIEPLILVDMPGFDSPLDTHNKAILNYIERGAHYIVLVSIEEGGLTAQALRRLLEIQANGRSFSICLSKTDLRTPSQVKEVVDHIASQLYANLGMNIEPMILDQYSAHDKLQALINKIDPDQLVHDLFSKIMKDIYFGLDSEINTLASTLDKDEKEIQQGILALKHSLISLEEENQRQIEMLREKESGGSVVDSVLNNVKQVLDENTDSLAQAAMTSQDSLIRLINDLVRESLVQSLRIAQSKLSEDTVRQFASAMENKIDAAFVLPQDMLTNLIDQLKDPLFKSLNINLGNNASKSGVNTGMASLGGIAISLAAKLHPVLTVAMAILPGVVDWMIISFKEKRQQEQIKQALRNQIFPDITRQLRPEIRKFLAEAMESVLSAVKHQYEQFLDGQRAIYSDAEHGHIENLSKIEDYKKRLSSAKKAIDEKAEAIIFAQ